MRPREQVLEQVLSQEKPHCPHCGMEMNIWEVPPIPVGDGLGWGTPYLFLCFNDDCKLYKEGWENLKNKLFTSCVLPVHELSGNPAVRADAGFQPHGRNRTDHRQLRSWLRKKC